MSKVLVVAGYTPSLINFRGDLLRLFVGKGHSVVALGVEKDPLVENRLNRDGIVFGTYYLVRSGVGVFNDFKTFLSISKKFYIHKPDVVLAYTIKPVIWSGIATLFKKDVRYYALITGLGYAFDKKSGIRKLLFALVVSLYKIALINAKAVMFQNEDNRNTFVQLGIVDEKITYVVNGSGVDLVEFFHSPKVVNTACIEFLAIGRLLRAKGFREYYEAARIVKASNPNVSFKLVGPLDPSPDGISIDEVKSWGDDGVIDYIGETNDVLSCIQKCDVFVLPSYHEGMPRTVLEAMAIGRPILTTNVAGCRDTVEEYVNGILVEKKDIDGLVCAMEWYIENSNQIPEMGRNSRLICERLFDVHVVNSKMAEVMEL